MLALCCPTTDGAGIFSCVYLYESTSPPNVPVGGPVVLPDPVQVRVPACFLPVCPAPSSRTHAHEGSAAECWNCMQTPGELRGVRGVLSGRGWARPRGWWAGTWGHAESGRQGEPRPRGSATGWTGSSGTRTGRSRGLGSGSDVIRGCHESTVLSIEEVAGLVFDTEPQQVWGELCEGRVTGLRDSGLGARLGEVGGRGGLPAAG